MSVTTVEGIGSTKTRLHPVQVCHDVMVTVMLINYDINDAVDDADAHG